MTLRIWPLPSYALTDDRSPRLAQHLEHQLHGHQHGIVATDKAPLRHAAGVVDQGNIERGFERAGGAGRNRTGCYRKLGREGLGRAAMGKSGADGRADSAMNLRARNAASGGEEMLRLRAYEKLQNLVARGAVRKNGKKYKGLPSALAQAIAQQNGHLAGVK